MLIAINALIVAEQTSEKRDKVYCFQAAYGTKEKNKEQIRLIKEY